MKHLIDLATAPAVPHGEVCLYSVAMTLRGNTDGSAEGTASVEELRACADYIQRRLDNWQPGRSESDEHLRLFIKSALAESLPVLLRWETVR